MSKRTFTNQILMIAVTAGALTTVSALADNVSADTSYYPAGQTHTPYDAAPQDTTRSLGTLRSGDMAQPQTPQMDAGDSVLQPVEANGVTYVTGGIGDEERSALDTMKPNYNLRITNSSADGAFVGGAHVVIVGRQGELIDAPAGPIFFARVAPGRYTVEVHGGGQVKKQTVTIGARKAATIHFSWK